jgi:glycerol-3-phosphate dehydrogenase (NAD(P)+)
VRVSIIGAGSWGTALALYLARQGHAILLWVYEAELVDILKSRRENTLFLPGHTLPETVRVTHDLGQAAQESEVLVLSVPAQHLRGVVRELKPVLSEKARILNTAKGIEKRTLARMSEVVTQELGDALGAYAALSGPTFAREVAQQMPSAAVIAGETQDFSRLLQEEFSGPLFRFYRTDDLPGVELAGALKNVYALASGMLRGLGFGSNSWAAMLTRAVHEMTRLCLTLGGRKETLSGLAGLGDLILTCASMQSRNYQVGVRLGEGQALPEILASMRMVAEGVPTCEAALALAGARGVELPIAAGVGGILFDGQSPAEVIRGLMTRSLKEESRL